MTATTLLIICSVLIFTPRVVAQNQTANALTQPGAQFYNGKALIIPIGDDATLDLLQRWHDQAFSGLFAAFANERVKTLPEKKKEDLQKCTEKAANPTAQAQCVVKMLDTIHPRKKPKIRKNRRQLSPHGNKKKKKIMYKFHSKLSKLNKMRKRKELKPKIRKITRFTAKSDAFEQKEHWVGGFRLLRKKRAIVQQRSGYSLKSENDNRTAFGIVAKHLTNLVRAIKNKNDTTPWSSTIIQLREKAKQIRWEKEFEKKIKKRLNIEDEPLTPRRKPVRKLMPSRPTKAGRFTDHPEEDILYQKIENYENDANQTKGPSAVDDAIQFIREGIKLSMMLTGKNVTNFDEKTIKLASPRIMPVVPEEPDPDTVTLLSPSLFGLHNEGEGIEEMTSITNLLKILPNKDQEDWLNLIVEASGVSDEVKRLESKDPKQERLKDQTGLNGRPMYFTRENVSEIYGDFETRKIDIHERLVKSLDPQQLDDLKSTGYAFMTKEQLHMFYGRTSPYNSSSTLNRLLSIEGKITNEHIEHDLRRVAQMKNFELRKKDIVLSPIINSPLVFASAAMSQPIVLSPVVFSSSIASSITTSLFSPQSLMCSAAGNMNLRSYWIILCILSCLISYATCSHENSTHFEIVAFHWHHVKTPYTIALWIVLASIAKILFHISKKFADTFPDSSLLIVVGLALGYGLHQIHVDDRVFSMESTVFFLYLLPPIIFEAGYFMPIRSLFENLDSVMLFAVVGTLWNTVAISVSLYFLGHFGLFSVEFSAFEILLFASLISAVDPVAVIAVFEEIHVNEFLFVNVFGEALFNDGVTVVLYQMFTKFRDIGEDNLSPVDYGAGALSFLVIALGGISIGLLFALVVSFVTKYTDKVKVLSPVFIFVIPYLSYLSAEMFGLSSILAIVSCGICMKQYVKENISNTASSSVKYFTKMLAQCAETIIFMFLGLSTISSSQHWDTWFVLLTILFVLLYRVIGVVVQCAILNRFRKKKFSGVDQFILSYGGLRGAIAFGLVVSLPEDIPAKNMFVTACIAVIYFTVFVQGITIRPLVHWLDVERDDKRQQTMLESVYSRYFDYTMAGVDAIAGQKGSNSIRDTYERFNATILRPLFVKHIKRNHFDASQIIRAYNKITLQEALDMAKKKSRIVERKRSSFCHDTVRSAAAAYANQEYDSQQHLDKATGDDSDVIEMKSHSPSLKNELVKFMSEQENAEALYQMFSELLDRKLSENRRGRSDYSFEDSDIEDDYMEAMVRPHTSVSETNINRITHDSTSLANECPADVERQASRFGNLQRSRSMGDSNKIFKA